MEYFQKTALGKFISALTEGERQMLFQCYITDFIVLTIGVSSQEELQVSLEQGVGALWVGRRVRCL